MATIYKDITSKEITDVNKKIIEKTEEVKSNIELERLFEELMMHEQEIESGKNSYNKIVDELIKIKDVLNLKITLPEKK